ncbi:hypothetical protein [Mesorhizobium sp. M0276]|uniref:hypothetical protein n=1 Tax=Mesorhizobium sp. M0276 TaxID=2956928 RepID=UPI00333AC14C
MALDLPVAGTFSMRVSGGRPMRQRTANLEERILALFKQAFRQGRSDVAEHLLRALEALDQSPALSESPRGPHVLSEAYYELVRR